jgi:hypothetical protein
MKIENTCKTGKTMQLLRLFRMQSNVLVFVSPIQTNTDLVKNPNYRSIENAHFQFTGLY